MLIYQVGRCGFKFFALNDLHFKVFTIEAPFQGVPEEVLFSFVGQQHKRLSRPTSEEAAKCGLTNNMWELLWECSTPTPGRRPQFSNIILATAKLVTHWEPVAVEESQNAFSEFPFHRLEPSSQMLVIDLFACLDIQDSQLPDENTITPLVIAPASDVTLQRQFSFSEDRKQVEPRRIKILRGHNHSVLTVAFSPNGSRLASGSYDQTIRLWDPATGAHLFTLQGHNHSVSTIAFSPNGAYLASGSEDKTIRLWDPATGAHLFTLQGHNRSSFRDCCCSRPTAPVLHLGLSTRLFDSEIQPRVPTYSRCKATTTPF